MPRKPRTRKSGRTISRSKRPRPRDQRDGLDPSILLLLPKGSGRFRKKGGLSKVWDLKEIRRIARQFLPLPDLRSAFKSIGGTYSGPGVPPEPHPGGDQADSLAVQDPGPRKPVRTGRGNPRALLPAQPFERHVAVFLRLADLAVEREISEQKAKIKRLPREERNREKGDMSTRADIRTRYLNEWGVWKGSSQSDHYYGPMKPPHRSTVHRHRREADLDMKQIDALILDAYHHPKKRFTLL